MIFLGLIGLFFVIFAEPVIRLFTHDPAVIPLAASCLRIISYGNIGYAYAWSCSKHSTARVTPSLPRS